MNTNKAGITDSRQRIGNQIIFEGCATALVTPFKDGKVDFDALGKILEHQITGGIKTLVLLGTTSEASTLEFDEEDAIIEYAKKRINGRAKIIVGTGSNDTKVAIQRSVEAKKFGADGLLIVPPYHNKCTQAGLVAHYNAITDAVKMPVILYNVPARTGMNMTPDTVLKLAENPYIAGLKEASSNFDQITALAKKLDGKLALYSGEDAFDYLYLALGAKGMISVAANAFPKQKVALADAMKKGDFKKGLQAHNEMLEMNNVLFCEVNPIPVKAMMHHLGLCTDEMRAPLTTIEKANREKLAAAYKNLKK